MTDNLIETIKKDLKEIIESEVKRFLEHYKHCEQTDSIHKSWDFKITKFDVLINGLPCDVHKGYIVKNTVYDEITDTICYIEYEDEKDTITTAYIEIATFYDKCFTKKYVDDERIEEVAKKIVEEAMTDTNTT
jgi:hypothetical protein